MNYTPLCFSDIGHILPCHLDLDHLLDNMKLDWGLVWFNELSKINVKGVTHLIMEVARQYKLIDGACITTGKL